MRPGDPSYTLNLSQFKIFPVETQFLDLTYYLLKSLGIKSIKLGKKEKNWNKIGQNFLIKMIMIVDENVHHRQVDEGPVVMA